MITVNGLTFSYGAEYVFHDATFSIGNNQKVGLIGPNGAGKSTLFRLLVGKEETEHGMISTRGTIGYVPQEVKSDPHIEAAASVLDYIDPHHTHEEFALKRLLAGLELPHVLLTDEPKKASDGQKTKLALARALLLEPDILLLDEPTNFMDKAGKKFVMDFLATYPKTLLVISHDLKLLDTHIDKILSINTQFHTIETYAGTYSEALKIKREADELLKRSIKSKQAHIRQMETALPKLYKFTSKKGVRARVRQQERIRREREKLPPMPQELKSFKLSLPTPPRSGEIPLMVSHIDKSFGEKHVLCDINMTIRRHEKMVIIGPNGAGKSTLIKIVMGIIQPDNGTVILNEAVKIGYYSQEFDVMDPEKSVLETVVDEGEITEQESRKFLGRFLFTHEQNGQSVRSLSGGEKTRLSVACLVLRANNLLILDEPTTYLDPMSQRIILEALKKYQGTLLLVSHSEDFVRELKPDKAFIMRDRKTVFWSDELLDEVGDV